MKRTSLLLIGVLAVSACTSATDKTFDRGFDEKNLNTLKAGIWVDPNGCHHWIIDDGVEGYLSARLTPHGKPVCTDGVAPPTIATGDFKGGTGVPDPI